MKQYLSNFDSTPLTCDPTVFPGKVTPSIAKSNRIFPGKEGEIKTLFLYIWIAQWLKFFCTISYFFSILTIFKRESQRGLKVGPKVVTLGPFLFHKYQKLDYTTANAILMKLTKIMFLDESKAFV